MSIFKRCIIKLCLLTSYFFVYNNGQAAEGKIREMKSNINYLDELCIEFPADVNITQGSSNSYVVSVPEKAFQHLKVNIQGGKLTFTKKKLDTKEENFEKITVNLNVKKLIRIESFGDVNLNLSEIISEKLAIHTKGSTDIKGSLDIKEFSGVFQGDTKFFVKGKIENQEIDAKGEVFLDLSEVKNQITSLRVQGNGKVFVDVQKKLWAQLSGAVECVYSGNPQSVESELKGSSSMKKI